MNQDIFWKPNLEISPAATLFRRLQAELIENQRMVRTGCPRDQIDSGVAARVWFLWITALAGNPSRGGKKRGKKQRSKNAISNMVTWDLKKFLVEDDICKKHRQSECKVLSSQI